MSTHGSDNERSGADALDGVAIHLEGEAPPARCDSVMLIGFGGLGFAGARASRSRAENVGKLSLRTQ